MRKRNSEIKLVFLCGARDFHAMDWYWSAKEIYPRGEICILTDLYQGEGFKLLINDSDIVYNMWILDRFLFRKQSKLANLWRNILKLLVFPIQVYRIRKFANYNMNAVFHAHGMYYLWLAWAAGVKFVGTPQGSDILLKPYRSRFFRFLSVKSLRAANYVTVDSSSMKDGVYRLAKIEPRIIQNGIDVKEIERFNAELKLNGIERNGIMSIRGLTPLYQIDKILKSRAESSKLQGLPITFIYPFFEGEYRQKINNRFIKSDKILGRVNRIEMYELIAKTRLVVSVPFSDSSPRSVYESIFCGAIVAIVDNPYFEALPACMKKRIIKVNVEDRQWLEKAYEQSLELAKTNYVPSEEALDTFDQRRSFLKMKELYN